ncbi:MAG: hypothetical protein Q4D81_06730 [Eubacteriales bacterium]|nr:hypothetical protein [Eubacteriales bacterium]
MSRRGRRRNGSDEINLTPLLDVLFTILFVVMLLNVQSEQTILADSENTKEQVAQLTDEVETLRNELKARNAVHDTEEIYAVNAVLVTMLNVTEDGNHVLKIYTGQNAVLHDTFRLGADRTQYISEHVGSIIDEIVKGAEDRPVFIVFYCTAGEIYRREEFTPIKERLESLKEEYKEVFYQIVEK